MQSWFHMLWPALTSCVSLCMMDAILRRGAWCFLDFLQRQWFVGKRKAWMRSNHRWKLLAFVEPSTPRRSLVNSVGPAFVFRRVFLTSCFGEVHGGSGGEPHLRKRDHRRSIRQLRRRPVSKADSSRLAAPLAGALLPW
jgi:hypothetical protein